MNVDDLIALFIIASATFCLIVLSTECWRKKEPLPVRLMFSAMAIFGLMLLGS